MADNAHANRYYYYSFLSLFAILFACCFLFAFPFLFYDSACLPRCLPCFQIAPSDSVFADIPN